MRLLPLAFLLGVLAAPAAAAPALPVRPLQVLDEGDYVVSVNGTPVAREHFGFEVLGDTLFVSSVYRQVLGPGDTLRKVVNLHVARSDYDLKSYRSNLFVDGKKFTRGVTLYTETYNLYRELGDEGEGITYERPPGRLFVLEPRSFVLFDVIARNLAPRTFESWPVQLITLSDTDTLVMGTAYDRGREIIRWGAKPVAARKLELVQGPTAFLLYLSPEGRLLRAEAPGAGLRVERAAPRFKPVAKPRPKPSNAATPAAGAPRTP